MAISYSLAVATASPPELVARALHEVGGELGVFDGSVGAEGLLGGDGRTALGMWVTVAAAKAAAWGDPVAEDLGFTPAVSVGFRLDKEGDLAGQQDEMVRLVSGLLDRIDGDAVLHFQFETIWLLRRAGELSLSERDDIWPAERLAAVSQPHRRATHAFA